MIIDDIVAGLSLDEQLRFRKHFAAATFVNVQNVLDYLVQQYKPGDLIEDPLKEFPNCVPPWRESMFTWKYDGESIAVLVGAVEVSDYSPLTTQPSADSTAPPWAYSVKWLVNYFVFLSPFSISSFLGRITLYLDECGSLIFRGSTVESPLAAQAEYGRGFHHHPGCPASHDDVAEKLFSYLTPVLLGTSFCHCKNVAVRQQDISPKLIRARADRNHIPVVSFYTLDIAPMTKVMADCGPQGTSLQKRLHLCRGHFKDYRQGGGLFGKQKGLYWWDMNLRGNSAKGAIVKDYAIVAP